MREEMIMLRIFLSIFMLLGFLFRYVSEDEWYKTLVDIFLILTIMYYVWCKQ